MIRKAYQSTTPLSIERAVSIYWELRYKIPSMLRELGVEAEFSYCVGETFEEFLTRNNIELYEEVLR